MELLIVILFYTMSSAGYVIYFFNQKDYFQKAGYTLLLIGFVFHCVSIGYGILTSGKLPAGTLHETLFVAGWALAGVFLMLRYRFHLKILGIVAAPLSAVIMIIVFLLPSRPQEAGSLLNSVWLGIHIVTVFVGEASFALACGTGALYLAQERAIKTKRHKFFYKRLPSLNLLDSTGYACIVVGFALLTIGLMTGFVYAKSVWGRFWGWDVKEIWSAISWLLYAALLHQRVVLGWRGRRAAVMSIIGFLVLLFTFFGVNFLMESHHGEFTRW